ncbi:MAG: 2'-deoxycytidine 5'-triphosphate deaminase [Candidatus Bruticola sp.]
MRQSGALPCQLIEELITNKRIFGSSPVPKENIQPASLDLRLGRRCWRVEAAFLPRQGEPVAELLLNNSLESLDLSRPTVLQEGATYVAEVEECFDLPASIHAYANNKSTTGRMNVWTRILADGVSRFDKIPAGYKGHVYVMITPRSWSIRVRQGCTLNQARLICGDNHLLDFELEMLHQDIGLVYDNQGQRGEALIDNGLLLTVDLHQDIVGYRAVVCHETIDLCSGLVQKGSNYFAPIKAENGEVLLKRGEFYILSTREFLRVPPDLAVEMVAYDIHSGEYRSHYAGFFDPGFGFGDNGQLKGTPAVLELDVHEDVLFRHAQPICKMAFEYLLKKPEKVYGSGLGSHYQQQRGPQLGRHFC